jgi:hypothetical protein
MTGSAKESIYPQSRSSEDIKENAFLSRHCAGQEKWGIKVNDRKLVPSPLMNARKLEDSFSFPFFYHERGKR